VKDPWKEKDLIISGKSKETEKRDRGIVWNWILYIGPNSPRRNGMNNTRKVCAMSADYQGTRQFLIGRRRERDSRRNVALILLQGN
jgi:hypothetical protein